MQEDKKIKVGISIGDINGVGVEVLLKTFQDSRMLDFCTPVVFASTQILSFYKKKLQINVNFHGVSNLKDIVDGKLNVFTISKTQIEVLPGELKSEAGNFAFESLSIAVEALKNEQIDVLVTAPINKENIQSEKFKFAGHTEYLDSHFNGESLMILMTDELRVGLVTGHIPIAEISQTITKDLVKQKLDILYSSLIQDFNISKPKIAVLGLNPHCGDNGVIGTEDETVIKPLLKEIQEEGKLVYGPFAADGFFGSKVYKQYDAVLAMYHDQGLAPFKALSFGGGVNFTAGLDRVRTSPDHGTGYEIAGKGKANESSFKEAVFTALEVYKKRTEYQNLKQNALKNNKK